MNHKRGRPPAARAGCAMCKPWKVSGAHAAKHRAVADRRVDFATAEQVAEYHHERANVAAEQRLDAYDWPDDSWMLEWYSPPLNPWQVPPLEVVRRRMQQRAQRDVKPPNPEPAWGLMAHAFTRRP